MIQQKSEVKKECGIWLHCHIEPCCHTLGHPRKPLLAKMVFLKTLDAPFWFKMPSWIKTLFMKLLAQDLVHNPSDTDQSVKGLCWAPGAPPQKNTLIFWHLSVDHMNTCHDPINWQIKGRRTAVLCIAQHK